MMDDDDSMTESVNIIMKLSRQSSTILRCFQVINKKKKVFFFFSRLMTREPSTRFEHIVVAGKWPGGMDGLHGLFGHKSSHILYFYPRMLNV